MTIFTFAFDISLVTTLFEEIVFNLELVRGIPTKDLGHWEVLSENILYNSIGAFQLLRHVRTSDTWRELRM